MSRLNNIIRACIFSYVLLLNTIFQLFKTECHLYDVYSKGSKILNILFFCTLSKMLFIRAKIHKIHVRIANRSDSDQTATSEAF